jgi:G:T/U-mismatch repair DNA glycosylase
MVKGFKKITGPNTKIVILGTFPSNISLEYRTYDKPTYYAGHGNNFWQLIGYSLDTNLIDLPFEKRYDILKNYGIGL